MKLREKGEKQGLPLSTIRISAADMMALQVRSRRSENPTLPEFLYQSLPIGAMTLMATLPRGKFPVSIPHQHGPNRGYLIQKSQPPISEGFVIIYALKRNRRYEAIEILFQGKRFKIEEFCKFAGRWVNHRVGRLRAIPGRYAYFSPCSDVWGGILRDCGYIALDPSIISSKITAEVRKRRESRLTSGVLARIPVLGGEKQPRRARWPVFAQVELTLDPHVTRQSRWISFGEYKKMRARQAHPPASIISDFLEWMERLTAESGFTSWILLPGMRFGAHIEWWGDKNRRRSKHEGIDFSRGRLSDGTIQPIREGMSVRAMADGKVIAILDDFINKTVVVRHPAIKDASGRFFCTLYSHIRPEAGLSDSILKGQPLGEVAKSKPAGAPAHLHFTGAWIPRSVGSGEITMDQISSSYAPVVLTDFDGLLGKEK